MTVEAIVKYIMESPENTNPAILKQMIQQIGGSNGMVVHLTSQDESTWVADKTVAEVFEAIQNGQAVVAEAIMGATAIVLNFNSATNNDDAYIQIMFGTSEDTCIVGDYTSGVESWVVNL